MKHEVTIELDLYRSAWRDSPLNQLDETAKQIKRYIREYLEIGHPECSFKLFDINGNQTGRITFR